MAKVRSIEELAEHLSTEAQHLQATFSKYNSHHDPATSEQRSDEFGKVVFPAPMIIARGQGMFIAQITPAVHYCMGGVKFTPRGEVVGKKGEVMSGLFAAGEVTGGLHGRNRLAGSSLLDCVVFGRRAGLSVANFLSTYNV